MMASAPSINSSPDLGTWDVLEAAVEPSVYRGFLFQIRLVLFRDGNRHKDLFLSHIPLRLPSDLLRGLAGPFLLFSVQIRRKPVRDLLVVLV